MPPRVLVPSPPLSTPRLLLRALAPEDTEPLAALFRDPEVARYLGREPLLHVGQMHEKLAKDMEEAHRGEAVRWTVTERQGGAVVGYAALFQWRQRDRRAEVGYLLARSHWGQGLMRELLPALLRFGFGEMRLHRIDARVDPRNTASLRLLERCGFRQEGLLRETCLDLEGRYADTALLGLLEQDWAAR